MKSNFLIFDFFRMKNKKLLNFFNKNILFHHVVTDSEPDEYLRIFSNTHPAKHTQEIIKETMKYLEEENKDERRFEVFLVTITSLVLGFIVFSFFYLNSFNK